MTFKFLVIYISESTDCFKMLLVSRIVCKLVYNILTSLLNLSIRSLALLKISQRLECIFLDVCDVVWLSHGFREGHETFHDEWVAVLVLIKHENQEVKSVWEPGHTKFHWEIVLQNSPEYFNALEYRQVVVDVLSDHQNLSQVGALLHEGRDGDFRPQVWVDDDQHRSEAAHDLDGAVLIKPIGRLEDSNEGEHALVAFGRLDPSDFVLAVAISSSFFIIWKSLGEKNLTNCV